MLSCFGFRLIAESSWQPCHPACHIKPTAPSARAELRECHGLGSHEPMIRGPLFISSRIGGAHSISVPFSQVHILSPSVPFSQVHILPPFPQAGPEGSDLCILILPTTSSTTPDRMRWIDGERCFREVHRCTQPWHRWTRTRDPHRWTCCAVPPCRHFQHAHRSSPYPRCADTASPAPSSHTACSVHPQQQDEEPKTPRHETSDHLRSKFSMSPPPALEAK